MIKDIQKVLWNEKEKGGTFSQTLKLARFLGEMFSEMSHEDKQELFK